MPIVKQAVPINFEKGLDLKTDPFQLMMGNFLQISNTVFTTGKRLTKRNGFGALTSLPNPASFITTFNDNLVAVGNQISALSESIDQWVTSGNIQPLTLSVLPAIRNNINQTQCDSAVASNGLCCVAYTINTGATNSFLYAVQDSITGQNIVPPTLLAQADPNYGFPRVFAIGNYFIIIYSRLITSVSHLSYVAVNINTPNGLGTPVDISTTYVPSANQAFDATVFNTSLYIAFQRTSTSMSIGILSQTLVLGTIATLDGSHGGTSVSVTSYIPLGYIWVTYYASGTTNTYTVCLLPNLVKFSSTFPLMISSTASSNITSVAGIDLAIVQEITNTTAAGVVSNFLELTYVSPSTGILGSGAVIRSLGLASKAFSSAQTAFVWGVYDSTSSTIQQCYQPTYFLIDINASRSGSPNVKGSLAYENAGGYLVNGLPSVTVIGTQASFAYLFKDLIEAISNSDSAGTTIVGPVYSQTGINIATIDFVSSGLTSAEIGKNLNINAGYLIAYDGYKPVENGFFLYPEQVIVASVTASGGGLMASDFPIFYSVTYEWTDNQGNAFRSAPSVAIKIASSGDDTTVVLDIPTLRVTNKYDNPVKICVYRWSTGSGNQTFYQVPNSGANYINSPQLNDPSVDYLTFTDISSAASIIGNNILYTTGGVIENIGPPSFVSTFIFDDRLWGIDSEDQNLLFFSKQVIEGTPVEMSDLLTIYVAPSIGAQGPTGYLTCGAAMDDKLILFKQRALYYINGSGPDNTGANSQYSQPTFITSMVGCSNQNSIVFQPSGLMFEFTSEVGNQIWLLGRDLSTDYIGKEVEALTLGASVVSSVSVPGTNQVRFHLSSGITLMYDYLYAQWGSFTNNAESATLYNGLHTYINSAGTVFQETPGLYLDGNNPVLLEFQTGWIQLSGISGYQRIWEIQLLGQYFSPHLLNVQMAYDFGPPSEQVLIEPINATGVYGSDLVYGQTSPYGGPAQLEQWRIQPATQKCQSFQMTLTEVYDPSFNVIAGEGFTLSAFTCLIGVQRGYRPVKAATTAGTS